MHIMLKLIIISKELTIVEIIFLRSLIFIIQNIILEEKLYFLLLL